MKNQFISWAFDFILMKWAKGYRTVILFGFTFLYNMIAWLLQSGLDDFLCGYFSWACNFESSVFYNKVLMVLSFLAMLLRLDTDAPIGVTPTKKNQGS